MSITLRLLGCEVLHLSTEREAKSASNSAGDHTSYPVGFVWED